MCLQTSFPLCPYSMGTAELPQIHLFMSTFLLLVKIKNPIWGLASFEMSSESWERNPGVTETHSHGLCTSKCLCLYLIKSGSSPRVQECIYHKLGLFPPTLYIPCLDSQSLSWFSVFPFTTHIYLPFSYFPPGKLLFPWQGQKNAI